MLGLLGMAGHQIAAGPSLADLVVVNTCAFIKDAQRESVDVLLEMVDLKRRGRLRYLIASGCLAQRHPEELLQELPELDAVVGTGQVAAVPQLVASLDSGGRGRSRPALVEGLGYLPSGAAPRLLTTPPWTAYLKVSEGCDNRCAYCVIPSLRGPHRSRPGPDLVAEARQLAAMGVRELVLVGQDLTRWQGEGPAEGPAEGPGPGQREGGGEAGPGAGVTPIRLPGLLAALAAVPGLRWLRLHYLHPARVDRELLRAMASEPKVCRYLDLPAQHGDDAVLAAMGRGLGADSMLAVAREARRWMPDLALRTTVITGFPGEDVRAFRRLLSFLHRLEPAWGGAFAYSLEAGTPAATMGPMVPSRVRSRRRGLAMRLLQRLSARAQREQVGRRLELLIETTPRPVPWPGSGHRPAVSGRTYREAPGVDGQVHLEVGPGQAAPPPGQFVEVLIVAAGPYDLYAAPAR